MGFLLGHSAWQIDQFPTCWPMNWLSVHWSRGWGVSSFSERLVLISSDIWGSSFMKIMILSPEGHVGFIKSCPEIFTNLLSMIFNNKIENGIYLNAVKIARILTIFKWDQMKTLTITGLSVCLVVLIKSLEGYSKNWTFWKRTNRYSNVNLDSDLNITHLMDWLI